MEITLVNDDCLNTMKSIPDNSIDMILCDMPYGTTRNKWDSLLPLNELWNEYNRITKDNSAVLLFSQQPFTATLINSNKKEFRYEWIWEKPQATGFLNANRMPMKTHENILVFYRKLPIYNPQFGWGVRRIRKNHHVPSSNYGKYKQIVTVSDGRRYPKDIIKFNAEHGFHPTQKPVELLEYLIKTYTNEGMTVLDNCMGSGSTGVACKNLNRNFLGIELNEDYYKIAEKRIYGDYK